ncbi:MAG: hypothetical protein ABL958_20535, partial [Bdellovibrionia bacterium]
VYSSPSDFFTKLAVNFGYQVQFPMFLSIVEKYMPLSQVKSWPMQQREGVYRFDQGDFFQGPFMQAMKQAAFGPNLSTEDKQLLEKMERALRDTLLTSSDKRMIADACRELETKAAAGLAAFKIPPQRPTRHPVSRCVSCHTNGDIGPRIPFQEPDAFRTATSANGGRLSAEICRRVTAPSGDPDLMPPTGQSLREKTQVLEYLNSIAPELKCR